MIFWLNSRAQALSSSSAVISESPRLFRRTIRRVAISARVIPAWAGNTVPNHLGARRVGYCLLQKPHVRAAIADLKAAILNRAHQRAEDEERAAALAREAEHDRLARLELTALLEIEEAERELKMLMRMHHEVIAGGRRHRVGSQGGAQSRFARVWRQYRGEPAHREPGRCCCGKLATSPRGASCDYCRERNRHYRRRYRAKVRRLRAV